MLVISLFRSLLRFSVSVSLASRPLECLLFTSQYVNCQLKFTQLRFSVVDADLARVGLRVQALQEGLINPESKSFTSGYVSARSVGRICVFGS